MASAAQCFYCFESLSASFKGTEPPSLTVIEELWEEYEASKRLALGAGYEGTEHEDDDEEERGEDEEGELSSIPVSRDENGTAEGLNSGADDTTQGNGKRPHLGKIQLPSISRLQEAPSSRSSSSSTPSALSVNSSRSGLTSASSTTSISPRPSSVFSQSKSYSTTLQQRDTSQLTYPLFVTWNTLSRNGHKSLRGCIGTFEPQELSAGLRSYALTSAFGDTRFSPITSSLVPSLSCSLTLLSSFETCSHALDWVLGTHGLRISFIHRNKRYGATYLPDVAVEQGWTKEETVESLMRKAGWDGHSSSGGGGMTRRLLRGTVNSSTSSAAKPWDEVSDFKTVRYQGLKASASYAEWQEWRQWVESSPNRQLLLDSGI